MNVRRLKLIDGEGFESPVWLCDSGRIFFVGDADIDSDGGSNPDGDPDWQPETTLKINGKSINAETVPGVVVPAWLPKSVKPIVLGCRVRATNLATMAAVECVCHDLGPLSKDGEMTPAAARRIGVNPNSVSGGEDNPIILYEIFPGVAALVDGVQYQLQRA